MMERDAFVSPLHRLDPRAKMLFLLCFIFVGVTVLDPVSTTVLVVFTLGLYAVARVPKETLAGITRPLLVAFVMFFLLNFPFAQPMPGESPLFYLIPPRFVAVTVTGILTGLANGLRFMMFIWMANLITTVTPTADILLGLAQSKVPPEITIAVSIAFSYIPVLESEFRTIVEAQKSRGARFEHRNPIRRFFAYIPVIVPALSISILRGRDIARAIESRGFTYKPECRTYRRTLRMGSADYALAACSIAAVLVVMLLRYRNGWFGYRFSYDLIGAALRGR